MIQVEEKGSGPQFENILETRRCCPTAYTLAYGFRLTTDITGGRRPRRKLRVLLLSREEEYRTPSSRGVGTAQNDLETGAFCGKPPVCETPGTKRGAVGSGRSRISLTRGPDRE